MAADQIHVTKAGRRAPALLIVLIAAFIASGATAIRASAAVPPQGLHVAGNRLLDGQGQPLTLRGVNRSGTEYACIQGFGIFDGPSNASSVHAIASWHVNFVRVPLNEDCWLGINHVKRVDSGNAYRRAILRYVAQLHRAGIYVELSLMWGAPGTFRATYQPAAPDEGHSPAMWTSMAATFKNDPNVILAPWGEPVVDPQCLRQGGICEATYGRFHTRYVTAGMQQAVDVMRAAGYQGVIAIPGVNYANDLSRWLAFEPRDPLHQLVAEAHVYGKNACSTPACLTRTMAPVAQQVPLLFGEVGETFDASSCASRNTSSFLRWADSHNAAGYAAWTWDTWGTCLSLISNYNGTPLHRYGMFLKSYYAGHAASTRRLGI